MKRSPKRGLRFLQFRLRTLLLVMAVAGPFSAWCEPHIRQWLTPPVLPSDDGPSMSFGLDSNGETTLDFDYGVDLESGPLKAPMVVFTKGWEPSESVGRRLQDGGHSAETE